MTRKKALICYLYGLGKNSIDHEVEWYGVEDDITTEIEAIVSAPSDRRAADIVRWWGCWDKKNTPTAFCRRVREKYKNLQEGKTVDSVACQ